MTVISPPCNHHSRDLTVADYVNMTETLSDYDNIYIDTKSKDVRLFFSKEENGRFKRCIVGKDATTNEMILYISYYAPKRNVDSDKKILASRVLGHSPYEPNAESSVAVAISSLRDASNQNVSSDPESVNEEDIRTQSALGEDAVDQGQRKYIRMDDERFNTLPRLLDLKRMLGPRKIRLRHRAVRHTRGCMYRQARVAISFFLILR